MKRLGKRESVKVVYLKFDEDPILVRNYKNNIEKKIRNSDSVMHRISSPENERNRSGRRKFGQEEESQVHIGQARRGLNSKLLGMFENQQATPLSPMSQPENPFFKAKRIKTEAKVKSKRDRSEGRFSKENGYNVPISATKPPLSSQAAGKSKRSNNRMSPTIKVRL